MTRTLIGSVRRAWALWVCCRSASHDPSGKSLTCRGVGAPREFNELADDLGHAQQTPPCLREIAGDFLRRPEFGRAQRKVQIAQDAVERVVELMGDASGQFPHRGHPLDVASFDGGVIPLGEILSV